MSQLINSLTDTRINNLQTILSASAFLYLERRVWQAGGSEMQFWHKTLAVLGERTDDDQVEILLLEHLLGNLLDVGRLNIIKALDDVLGTQNLWTKELLSRIPGRD
jgi:hypothetical protein